MTSVGPVDVCIIGSGVAGLSAALSLQKAGLNVQVYERDFDFVDRKQGYGLTLTYSTDGPLSKLGVLEECIAQNCPSHSHYTFDATGSVLGYFGRELKTQSLEERAEQGGNRGNLRIPRQDLRMMLIRKLKPDTIQWGYSLIDYSESVESVSVTFEKRISGSDEQKIEVMHTSILVGADGIRSIVRQLRDQKNHLHLKMGLQSANNIGSGSVGSGPDGTKYLNVAVIIGLSAVSHPHVNNRGFYVLDGTNRMFTMPYVAPQLLSVTGAAEGLSSVPAPTSGQTMWQLSFSGLNEEQATAMRKSGPKAILAEALRRTEGWFAPVQEMIRGTLPGELWATGLYDRDPMAQFGKGSTKKIPRADLTSPTTDTDPTKITNHTGPVGGTRVTVIGDAAHPMSMFKGQGANQALADGPLLAQWLVYGASKIPILKEKRTTPPLYGECDKSKEPTVQDNSSSSAVMVIDQLPAKRSRGDMTHRAVSASDAARDTEPSPAVPVLSRSFLQNPTTVFTRLRCFEREMCARTTPKVLASRQAAQHLHSPQVLDEIVGIAGVSIRDVQQNHTILSFLRDAGINATLGSALDREMKTALAEIVKESP